jgi:hypothetical protein
MKPVSTRRALSYLQTRQKIVNLLAAAIHVYLSWHRWASGGI